MAMRCLGRARFAAGPARALVLRSLALMIFRAVDLLAVLRGGDFFCAAERAAARGDGFSFATDGLPYQVVGERVAHFEVCFAGSAKAQPPRSVVSAAGKSPHFSLEHPA